MADSEALGFLPVIAVLEFFGYASYVQTNARFLTTFQAFEVNRPVGRTVTRSSLEREVWYSNLGPVKSDSVLPIRLATAAAFLQKKLCSPGAMTQRWALPTRYTLCHNTARIIKKLISLESSCTLPRIYRNCKQFYFILISRCLSRATNRDRPLRKLSCLSQVTYLKRKLLN